MRRDLVWLLVLLPAIALTVRVTTQPTLRASARVGDTSLPAVAHRVFEGLAPVDVQVLDHPRMRWHYRVHLRTSRDIDADVRRLLEAHRAELERAVWPRGAVVELSTEAKRLPDLRVIQEEGWGGVGARDAVADMEHVLDARLGPGRSFVLFVPGEGVSAIANVGARRVGRDELEGELRRVAVGGLPVHIGLVDDWSGVPAWQ